MTAERLDTLRTCIGCGEPTPATRCPACAAVLDHRRPNAHARGYGPQWQRTAGQVKRLQPSCAICGTTDRLSVDHIVAKANGGTDEPANLQTLCITHNAAKGKR